MMARIRSRVMVGVRVPRARRGIAALVLVMVFLGALFFMTFATSFQSSTTARSYARAVLTRTCIESAESAFAEAIQTIQHSLRVNDSNSRTSTNWLEALMPPYDRGRPGGTVNPKRSRQLLKDLYGVEVSDVEVEVVNWMAESDARSLVRAHGVLEMRVKIEGRRGSFQGERVVRCRVQYTMRYKPISEVPPSQVANRRVVAPLSAENAHALLFNRPLGLVVD